MAQSLAAGLSVVRGVPTVVTEIHREPFSGSSSFATERVRVLLSEGEWINVFFKDLNPRHLLDEARNVRDFGLERSLRELLMYRDVLPMLQLGTPRLYGYRWEPSEDVYWIFLEDAGPKRLSRLGDFTLWTEATRWIARLHAVDPRALAGKADFLSRHDREHYEVCAQRLENGLARFDAQQRTLIAEALERYRASLDYLRSLPLCLIHGEYFGKNVMIRPGRTQDPIAIIDWETAALGPRCVDLVSITAGRWTPEQRDIMCKAYAEQYGSETGKTVDVNDLNRELRHVALYRALWWLGYWSEGDDAHVIRWVRELEAVMSC